MNFRLPFVTCTLLSCLNGFAAEIPEACKQALPKGHAISIKPGDIQETVARAKQNYVERKPGYGFNTQADYLYGTYVDGFVTRYIGGGELTGYSFYLTEDGAEFRTKYYADAKGNLLMAESENEAATQTWICENY